METVLAMLTDRFGIFLLILVRCSCIFVISPIFGRRNIPAVFKVGLSLMLSIILLPTINSDLDLRFESLPLAALILKEAIVGLIMGYITYVVFSAIYFAGQIIDMKTGFGIVNVIDPQTSTQVPIMGNFIYIFTLIVFISIDGHLMLIKALSESFEIVPIGQAQVTAGMVTEMVSMLADTFVIGFKLSAPVIAAVFLTDVALGILARTMPQMNVFMVGMPLKIIIGIFTLMIMVPFFAVIMDVLFRNTAENIYKMLLQL